MRKILAAAVLLGLFALTALAQTNRERPRVVTDTAPTPETKSSRPELKNDTPYEPDKSAPVLQDNSPNKAPTDLEPPPPLVLEDDEIIKIDTNFVTLPVSVLDRDGRFIAGLRQNDFKIYENGAEQRVEYFASVETPFTVVLLLDVSPSTQYKIDEIRMAAITFVDQLRPNDTVMVVAFDEDYQVLTRPTSDRMRLRNAISRANFGSGTSLYDAVGKTIDRELRGIPGRKAVVVFTDGVDTTSRLGDYQSTIRQVEEVDALIYPVRYDTYRQYVGGNGGYGGRRRPPVRTGNVWADILAGVLANQGGTIRSGQKGTSPEEYRVGRMYLEELARYSGGRMFEADTVSNLDLAFRSIAEELRRQYSLGYYPEIAGEAGDRKRIRVRVRRPNVVVRTKNSYIVGNNSSTMSSWR
ncbi:MAG: VWA domain-containing protein [Acidobacteria bacterium]|nr:MAG: VWA domain-containing protein [Acidobacteriota bacterium]REK02442.1 MAG: VWA domain-containing protein [Acidobacteriota bacterium]REK13757.1 MAG: VWA domain-containing protein [Acidobacteriota bacterium]REK41751.1 MAG: VWA domain-containing protein [Acidobacteriota bacterium]